MFDNLPILVYENLQFFLFVLSLIIVALSELIFYTRSYRKKEFRDLEKKIAYVEKKINDKQYEQKDDEELIRLIHEFRRLSEQLSRRLIKLNLMSITFIVISIAAITTNFKSVVIGELPFKPYPWLRELMQWTVESERDRDISAPTWYIMCLIVNAPLIKNVMPRISEPRIRRLNSITKLINKEHTLLEQR